MQDIVNVFANMGSAVACLVACMWYIVQKDKGHAQQVKEIEELHAQRMKDKDDQIERMREAHSQESKEIVEALNRNTVAITELTTMLKGGRGNDQ